jgi:hypothetical protein
LNISALRKYILWVAAIALIVLVEVRLFFITSLFVKFFLYFLIYSIAIGAFIAKFHELAQRKPGNFLYSIYLSSIVTLIVMSLILPCSVALEFISLERERIPGMYIVFSKGLLGSLWKSFLFFLAFFVFIFMGLKFKRGKRLDVG